MGECPQFTAKHYDEILVVGIAAYGETERAFSADTGMAELLIVATRKKKTHGHLNDIFVDNVSLDPELNLKQQSQL